MREKAWVAAVLLLIAVTISGCGGESRFEVIEANGAPYYCYYTAKEHIIISQVYIYNPAARQAVVHYPYYGKDSDFLQLLTKGEKIKIYIGIDKITKISVRYFYLKDVDFFGEQVPEMHEDILELN